jgi:hypothetical protein
VCGIFAFLACTTASKNGDLHSQNWTQESRSLSASQTVIYHSLSNVTNHMMTSCQWRTIRSTEHHAATVL